MAFPTTSLLDDFNRGDDAGALGANWNAAPLSGYGSLGISSSQAYAAATFKGNYWNTSYAADQEVWVTLPVIPTASRAEIYARLQNPGGGAENGYYLRVTSAAVVELYKVVAATPAWLWNDDGTNAVDGVSVGMELIGTTINIYIKPPAGAWALEDTVVNGDVTGAGYLGLIIANTTSPRFDDFGGGEIVSGTAPTLRTVRSSQRW